MILKKTKTVFFCIVSCLILTACNFPGLQAQPTKTSQADEVQSVLQTAMANAMLNLTQTAAVAKPVSGLKPSNTPAPVVIPTIAVVQPTVQKDSGTDAAALAGETIPDETKLLPGTTFTKTWRLMNSGSSTWTTSYRLVFVEGDQMGAKVENWMPLPVEPGKIIDMSVSMKAPDTVGSYKGYWKIKNASDKTFGPGGNNSFSVKIVVAAATATPTLSPTVTSVPATATVAPTATTAP